MSQSAPQAELASLVSPRGHVNASAVSRLRRAPAAALTCPPPLLYPQRARRKALAVMATPSPRARKTCRLYHGPVTLTVDRRQVFLDSLPPHFAAPYPLRRQAAAVAASGPCSDASQVRRRCCAPLASPSSASRLRPTLRAPDRQQPLRPIVVNSSTAAPAVAGRPPLQTPAVTHPACLRQQDVRQPPCGVRYAHFDAPAGRSCFTGSAR